MQYSASPKHTTQQKQLICLRILAHTLGLTVFCAGIFLVARLAILWFYGPLDSAVPTSDLWLALWTGLRFDVAIALRVLLLGVLFSLITLTLPSVVPSIFAWRCNRTLGYLLLALATILSVSNFAYVGFFDRPLDSFVFESMSYGLDIGYQSIAGINNAALTLFFCIALLMVNCLLYTKMNGWIVAQIDDSALTNRQFIGSVITSLIIIAILGRGTVSTFPLSYRHLVVSSHSQINNLVPNGIIALYYGQRNFRKSESQPPVDEQLGRQIFSRFFSREPTKDPLFKQFFTRTKPSSLLEENPPHVVLNLLESMGQALLLERFNQGDQLAGRLQQHLASDIYFKHFLPSNNGTQHSLISLLLNTEYSNISHSIHQHIALETSAARIFQRAGYKTVFIYSGFEGLMNRGNYLKGQGFDEFIGAHQLQRLFPTMQTSVWGGEDRYVFETAANILEAHKTGEKPLFIVNLTIVNHPPYKMPDAAAERDTEEFTLGLLDRLDTLPVESLRTYRYSNDQLGEFISRIKGSSLRDKTLIAATGDHSIRGMRFTPAEQLHQLSVPFYLYIPSRYAPRHTVNSNRVGSHKDIMPTLYHLALSDARYPNLGRNLVNPSSGPEHEFAYHTDYLLLDNVAYSSIYSTAPEGLIVTSSFDLDHPVKSISPSLRQAAAYSDMLDWLTRYQLNQTVLRGD